MDSLTAEDVLSAGLLAFGLVTVGVFFWDLLKELWIKWRTPAD
jgi:hypothetical protein